MPISSTTLSAVERKIQNKNNNGASVKRSKSFNSTSAPSSPSMFRRKKQPVLEPRYTKSTYLLIEAKKLAKELEEKKKRGTLFPKPQSVKTISLGPRSRSGSGSTFGFKRFRRPNTSSESRSPRSESPVIDGRLSSLRNSGRRRNFIATSQSYKTCEECDRTLKSGFSSEHRGLSYCNVPCYTSLFSSLYAGADDIDSCSTLSEQQKQLRCSLIPKLRTYNTYYSSKPCQISCREINDKFVLEGVIKVYWGLQKPVTLSDSDVSHYWNHFHPDDGGCQNSNHNNNINNHTHENNENEPPIVNGDKSSNNKPVISASAIRRAKIALQNHQSRYNYKQKQNGVIENGQGGAGSKRRGCYACNYDQNNQENTTSFVPPRGTPTTLRVTNHVTAPIVIDMLLKKFQIRDDRKRFMLFTVYESGGQKRLMNDTYPLLTRISLGPCEDVAKIFIMDSSDQADIPLEVAQYINFSSQVLQTFVQKFYEEEQREENRIKEKYDDYKTMLMNRIKDLEENNMSLSREK